MTKQIRVHLDYETFSEADLLKVGGAAYARHPSTKILMASWAYAEGDAKQWDYEDGPMPQELVDILENKEGRYLVHAQNAAFEILITLYNASWVNNIDVPYAESELDEFEGRQELLTWLKNWRCTMVMGFGLSMPGALADVGIILGLDESLLKTAKEGKRLIRQFCVPNRKTKANPSGIWNRANDPENWGYFLDYNKQDVIAERANFNRLKAYNPMPGIEWEMWHVDQLINLTGMPIDQKLVEAAIAVDAKVQDILKGELKQLTGLNNPNSVKQFVKWMKANGIPAKDARKETITALIKEGDLGPKQTRALELRQVTSKTSVSKYEALKRAAGGPDNDGILRGVYQYGGAQRTRRWAGRIFQPQNLPRGVLKTLQQMQTAIRLLKTEDLELLELLYGSVDALPDILSSVIRNAVVAPEGKTLTVADLASIETIMTWWAAGATTQMDKVRKGLDAYIAFGTKLLEKPYDAITKAERTYCKPAVLGCCYRLGGPGLVAYAESMGVKMTKKEGYRAVDIYRDDNPEVVALWDSLETAFKTCLTTGENQVVNGKFRFRIKKPCVFIDLPSGRSLCYVQPKILPRVIKYEDRKTGRMISKDIMSITYMGIDQYTRKWARQDTHGGKLLENIIQAVARDVLRDALVALSKEPEIKTIGHVHDEAITVTPKHEKYRAMVESALVNSSPWCADAPLSASSYQAPFFLKD